jgi:predicted amidophosphoribosyltransferase
MSDEVNERICWHCLYQVDSAYCSHPEMVAEPPDKFTCEHWRHSVLYRIALALDELAIKLGAEIDEQEKEKGPVA